MSAAAPRRWTGPAVDGSESAGISMPGKWSGGAIVIGYGQVGRQDPRVEGGHEPWQR